MTFEKQEYIDGITVVTKKHMDNIENGIIENQNEISKLKEDIANKEVVTSYDDLINVPTINGNELKGNMTNESLGLASPTNEQITNAVNSYLNEKGVDTIVVNDKLHEQGIVEYSGTEYKKYPMEVENYSWNHLVGTKRLAPLVENATLFTTEGATAHESNAVGFNTNWFLLQWVQNIKGTTVDMEDANGSCEIQGKLQYWRYGISYNKTGESETFTIAKQGDSIKRIIANDTITASGGVGICNVANKDSKTVYSIVTYYHNGKHIPTTREIAIDNTDYTTNYEGKLSIGEVKMWTITKDGVTSDFEDNILGTEYGGHVNCQIYCDYNSSGYNYYMAVVRPNKGISIITSTDCTNWTWIADVDIPCENTASIETAFAMFGNRWYVAVRCQDGRLWVGKLLTDYTVNWNFFLNDCGSKPVFIRWNKSLILVTAPQSRYSCRLYRFTSGTKDLNAYTYPDRIEAIGDITYNACNYPFYCGQGGYPNYASGVGGAYFLCLGTNNFVTNKLGCSYFVDQLFAYLKYPNEAVNSLNEQGQIPSEYVTEEELNAKGYITNIKTINGESLVGDGDITIQGGSSGSSGGYVVDTLINITTTEEVKYVEATIDSVKYRKFYAYIKTVGTTTNTNTQSIVLVANPTVANSQGFAMSPSVSNINSDGANSYVDIDVDMYNGCAYSLSHLALNNAGTQSGYQSRMFTNASLETVFKTLRVQFNNQWATFGIGTQIKVFGVRA